MSREKFSIRLMIQLIMSKGEDKIGRSGLFLEMKRMKQKMEKEMKGKFRITGKIN